MKFECDSCHASYMIADEKVGKRGVKVKCKRCGHVIIVRAAAPAPDDAAAAPEGATLDGRDDGGDAGLDDTLVAPPIGEDAPPAPPSLEGADDDEGAFASSGETPSPPADDDESPFSSSSSAEDEPPAPPADDDEAWSASEPAAASSSSSSTSSADLSAGLDGPTRVGAVPGWRMDGQSGADTELASNLPDATVPGAAPPEPGPAFPDDEHAGAPGDADPLAAAPPSSDDVPAPALSLPEPGGDDVPAPPAEPGVDALDAQIAGAFSDMFGALPAPAADEPVPAPPVADDMEDMRGPTRVLDLAQMEQLRAAATPSLISEEDDVLNRLQTQLGGPSDEESLAPFSVPDVTAPAMTRPALDMPDDSGGWHIAIDDEDVGPIRLSELVEHVESGRADVEALVWRSGMGDWTPANEVPEIKKLLRSLPMPSIAGRDGGDARFDVGAPIDDVGAGGGLAADPFSVVADASDPNWRPHGLTEVYQAANLAEAAGARPKAASPITPDDDEEEDAGWKPGAASALASLVADEIKRIEAAPEHDEEPSIPPLGDDLGILAATSGSVPAAPMGAPILGMADPLEASSPALGAPMSPLGARSAIPTVESFPPMPVTGMPYAPVAQPPRSMMVFLVGGGVAVLLLVIAAALVKIAFLDPRAPAVVVAPPPVSPNPDGAGTGALETKPNPPVEEKPADPSADADAKPPVVVDDKPAGDPPADPAGDGKQSDPAGDDGKAARADEPKAERGDREKSDKGERSAKADRGKKDDAKRDERKAERAEKAEKRADPPKEKEKPVEKEKPKSKKDCDPVLDFDCDEKKGASASSAKATLSKADVLAVVKQNISKVNACGKSSGFSGTIKMQWSIEKSGRTSDVRVLDSDLAGTAMGRCMTNEIKRWVFPKFTGSPPPPIKFPFKV